jgi:hypothetical protein
LSDRYAASVSRVLSRSGYCAGLSSGHELAQITQEIVPQFRKAVDFPLCVDRVLPAQVFRFVSRRRQRMQVSGKASRARKKICNLPLGRGVEQIQTIRV